MTRDTTPLLALLACCGLVLAGVAAGVPLDATPTAANDAPTASVALGDQQNNCNEPFSLTCVTAESYTLPDGGFIAVYDGDGELLFVTGGSDSGVETIDYIEPGSYNERVLAGGGSVAPPRDILVESQTLTAVAFRDTDGDRLPDVPQTTTDLFAGTDQPYTVSGTPVTDEQDVVVGDVPLVRIEPGEQIYADDVTVESGDRLELDPYVLDDVPVSGFEVEWTQTAGPPVELTASEDAERSPVFFTAPEVSTPVTLTFRLRVTDGQNNTGTDFVNVTVVQRTGPNSTVTFADGETQAGGTQVVLESVELDEGGFVTVRDAGLGTDTTGSVIGVSEYLDAGTHESVVVDLFDVPGASFERERLSIGSQTLTAVLHRDTDGDRTFDFVASGGAADAPYTYEGDSLTDDALVTYPGYYQVDLIGGLPYDRLGPHADNDFYADSGENRLLRWAHGEVVEPREFFESQGNAWPNATLRQCVGAGLIEYDETNDTASVRVTVTEGCAPQTLTLAVYDKPRVGFSREDNQTLVASTTRTLTPDTYTLTVDLPDENEA
ncbi:DUF7282 domain-containing protein [Salinirubrum litoreum]|uniref:DUF7282 domain-containing protein n=1 Tax=Salinirubrum litoreum TaxID=1126234 RepID=A0ABD5RDF6_9EURY|nr:hypothetical protein [Salinirubrum litoreum]